MEKENTRRRDFMKKSLALGSGLVFSGSLLQTLTADAGTTKETMSVFSGGQPVAANEKEFRMGVIGPAELSLVTSQIATTKAMNKNAKEFAGFELAEAIAVTSVLKDLGTPVPQMDVKARATLEKIKSTPAGREFDKLYIKAQLENHEFLRDLAQNYLSKGKLPGMAENQGRHLATLSLAVFKEHVAITSRILKELSA